VFDAQNLGTVPVVKLTRFLGHLPREQLAAVETAVKAWLGFPV
jgi:mRNA-degrading endonuclease toxin of MazEF toxin-antitoxin module